MGFKGEVAYIHHVANDNPNEFFKNVKEGIEKCGDLYAEVQYQQSTRLDGKALWSALVIGRKREND